jgi:hypothetical protein
VIATRVPIGTATRHQSSSGRSAMEVRSIRSNVSNQRLTIQRYYHYAMGAGLSDMPDISWKYVLKEKSEDMIHVLQFPYNGEPPRVSKHSQTLS